MIPINQLAAAAHTIPTATPESDGTLEWNSTTLIVVELEAGGKTGLGYSYADRAIVDLIREKLAKIVIGSDAYAVSASWIAMVQSVRNLGRPGMAAGAIAAVDTALWDLKAKLLGLPLVTLLGQVRPSIPVYGSGGFTSYSLAQLQEQLGGWALEGITRVKMKIGREPMKDPDRVKAVRAAIGPDVELFVDANGALTRTQALALAQQFRNEANVAWFEEPVSSDDLDGLRWLRDRAPAGMDIAAGEYGYDLLYFRGMLEAGAVDVLQADATRCLGITGFLQAGMLCDAYCLPFSAHTAPSVHVHPCCALGRACHVEYFFDHARIEKMLFDGAAVPVGGQLKPDLSRPGLGIEFKHADAARFAG